MLRNIQYFNMMWAFNICKIKNPRKKDLGKVCVISHLRPLTRIDSFFGEIFGVIAGLTSARISSDTAIFSGFFWGESLWFSFRLFCAGALFLCVCAVLCAFCRAFSSFWFFWAFFFAFSSSFLVILVSSLTLRSANVMGFLSEEQIFIVCCVHYASGQILRRRNDNKSYEIQTFFPFWRLIAHRANHFVKAQVPGSPFVLSWQHRQAQGSKSTNQIDENF